MEDKLIIRGARENNLKNINIDIPKNKLVIMTGLSGSGKTSLINLLCRLYDPTEGEILLNGVNIKKYDYEEHLRLFAVVFQDFEIFLLYCP